MSAPTLVQKISNVKHMPVLLAATSATKDPADNFLVKDIIKMSYESVQTRIFLQQYLVNQLITSNNVYSKVKILRLFVTLLEEGHIEFRQNLRKTPEPFNEAMKLKPYLHSDSKMQSECGRIRDMASKVLDLLYSDVPELRRPSNIKIDSISSSDHRDSGPTRITGFGSSSESSKSTTTDKLKSLFGSSGKSEPLVYDPSYATMDPVPHNVSSSQQQQSFSVHVPSRTSQTTPPTGARHERGQAGGGWGSRDDRKSSGNPWSGRGGGGGGGGRDLGDREVVSVGGGPSSSYESSGIEQEQLLVEKILAPGGVRVAPPREDLNRFINRCKVLDCQSVVECLRLKLSSEEINTVLRALFIMESLLRSDVPDIVSHFDLALQDLTDLTASSNSSIKAKANKIMMLLASAQKPAAVSSKTTGTQQLTSSGDDEVVEEEEEEDEEDKMEEPQGIASIFSGLSVSGEKSQRPKQPAKKKTPKRATPSSTKKSTRPSASPGSSRNTQVEQKSNFGDILGLGDLSVSGPDQSTGGPSSHQDPQLPPAMMTQQPDQSSSLEDNSLLTFEEDVEFDPLKHSDSLHRSDSIDPKPSPSAAVAAMVPSSSSPSSASISYATQPALLEHCMQALPEAMAPMMTSDPTSLSSSSTGGGIAAPVITPTTSAPTTSQLGDLSGISLDLSAAKKPPQKRQESLGELYQMAQNVSGANNPATTSVGLVYPQGMVPVVSGAPPGVQMPLGVQGNLVYGPGMVPVVYAPQGPQGVMYQPQFGGVSRPVQIATASKEQASTPDAGFSFIGKSNKTNAFDFVQDEMKATTKK